MQKKIEKTIIHSVRTTDNDIHMPNNTTKDTWNWFLEIVCDSSSGWGDLSNNVCSILEKIKIKDDYNFQHRLLNFVSRKMGVNIEYETECYIEQ
jgi:hypothetical protein